MNQERNTLHIFGGGALINTAVRVALESGWDVKLRTGARFASSLSEITADIPIYVGDDLEELLARGGAPTDGDIGLSLSAPWVFPQAVIDCFRGNIFNLHNQPLPKFKGGGGTSWLALMNDRAGGCCIHRLVKSIDAGEIYARRDFRFPAECKVPDDYDRVIIGHAEDLLGGWLRGILRTNIPGAPIPIVEAHGEYWPRLNTDIHGWLDWSWSLQHIEAFCNAFGSPHKGARTNVRGQSVRVKNIRTVRQEGKFHPFQCGIVYHIGEEVAVAHTEGTVYISSYEIEGAALSLRLGDRFFTPRKMLEKAMTTRVQYLPSGAVIEI